MHAVWLAQVHIKPGPPPPWTQEAIEASRSVLRRGAGRGRDSIVSVQAESNSGQARGSGGEIVGSVGSIKRSRGAATDQINETYTSPIISPPAYLYPVEDNSSDFKQPKVHDEGSSSSPDEDDDNGLNKSKSREEALSDVTNSNEDFAFTND